MSRRIALVFFLVLAVTVGGAAFDAADAQTTLCTSTPGFATSSGTTACTGSAVSTSATVKTSATLILNTVFTQTASSAAVAFGNVDAQCQSTPATGITCTSDTTNVQADWYGDVGFIVRLGGLGTSTAKLTTVRGTVGAVP